MTSNETAPQETLEAWLAQFCKDVFVDPLRADKAHRVVKGAVGGFVARHGSLDRAKERGLMERAGWFLHDSKILDAVEGLEDMRDAVIEELERLNGRLTR